MMNFAKQNQVLIAISLLRGFITDPSGSLFVFRNNVTLITND